MTDEEHKLAMTWIEGTQKRWLGWFAEIRDSLDKSNESLKLQGEALDRIAKKLTEKLTNSAARCRTGRNARYNLGLSTTTEWHQIVSDSTTRHRCRTTFNPRATRRLDPTANRRHLRGNGCLALGPVSGRNAAPMIAVTGSIASMNMLGE